jgi:hypothetical protein
MREVAKRENAVQRERWQSNNQQVQQERRRHIKIGGEAITSRRKQGATREAAGQ